jgi:ADP-ribosylglycohydrolase
MPHLYLLVQYNQKSLSNGCLMRITPLPIWGSSLSPNELAAAAKTECSLTHPNKVAQVSGALHERIE